MATSDFLERNQEQGNPRRTKVIELFVKKAGDKLGEITALAEDLCSDGDLSFERSLADALECYKIK